jgi:outer membrane protein OmpA-like peptidoglycan-associated protein
MRRFLMVVPIAVLALGGSTACASKGFVRRNVADVDRKVDSFGRSLENTQERTRKNEVKIGEVDEKVQIVDRKAVAAGAMARDASVSVLATSAKMDALDKSSKRLDYDLVFTQAEGNFRFGDSELPESAKAKIDEVIRQLVQDPKNVHIEIEGHTDRSGFAARPPCNGICTSTTASRSTRSTSSATGSRSPSPPTRPGPGAR